MSKNSSYISNPENFYYKSDGTPMWGSQKLAHKLVELENRIEKRFSKMSTEEILEYVKPLFEECGVEFMEC